MLQSPDMCTQCMNIIIRCVCVCALGILNNASSEAVPAEAESTLGMSIYNV